MNSLSWFLYLSDIFENLGIVLILSAIGMMFAGGIYLIFGGIEESAEAKNTGRYLFRIGIPLLIVSALLPSKKTMYAIAASEVGERIVKSEQVQGITDDATKALQQWIKKQIEPEAKK